MKVKNVPLLVNGSLDTKTNPKLLRSPAVLQLDNLYQQRTGELRVRNGMTAQPAVARTITGATNLYASPAGVAAVVRGINNTGVQAQAIPARFGAHDVSQLGWESANGTNQNQLFPFPSYTCRTESLFGDSGNDLSDGDIGVLGTLQAVTAFDSIAGPKYKVFDSATGRPADYATLGGPVSTRPYVVCTTANYFVVAAVQTTGSPYSIELIVYGANGSVTAYTPIANLVATATPWLDVTADSGNDTVTIAYKASAGGVSAVVVNVATGAVTVGPTNYPSFDASMCLGWLGNTVPSFGAGHATLAMAGSSAGVTYRIITTSTLVAGATITIDGTATANVRQVAGHWDSVSQITVLWELSDAGSRIYDLVKRGRFTGSTTIVTLAPSFSIYSRTAKGADGKWYFVGAYDSPVQASYALLSVDDYVASVGGGSDNRTAMMCQVMAGEGGGRRAAQSSVANLLASGSQFTTAMPRKKRVTVAGVSASQGRIQQRATFSDALPTMTRARELGGVVYVPGGAIYADDGQSCRIGVFPRYPEQCSGVSAAGGSMTSAKSYGYRLVFMRQDNSGRLIRSAGSVPFTITLGASDTQVTLTVQNPSLSIGDYSMAWQMEVYRVGPIESGATLYNKVGRTGYVGGGGTTTTFVDQMSDANAAFGEVAYFTGNVEENVAPPSTSILEVNAGRLWAVNAEDPTELWPSKQAKAGTVPGFTSDFSVRVDGDGRGAVTALASLDGRLVVFKDSAIWVISGDGPNDENQGSFNPPQNVSRDVGVPAGLARSVVTTPDGVMFQSAKGIWLLDHNLGLSYIGAPVEQYTLAENVVDASTVRASTQVRFVMPSGRCLVYDYFHKAWYTFILPVSSSAIVACADAAAGWYYITANAVLRLETPGATNDDNVAIIPTISLPHLDFAGLSGYQRLRALDIVLDVVGNHTVSVDAEFNYSGALTGSPKTKALTTGTPTIQLEYLPPEGLAKCTSCRPVITVSGSPTGGSFRLTSVTAVVGIKQGTNVPASNRLT